LLDSPGYRLVRAESADQALLALVAEEFAVLILDVRMPGMTGFELAQIIKGRKKTSRIPIIFLTAYYGEDQHVLEGYGSGAVDYLHKPVNGPVLCSKVAVFAELHRKGREVEISNRALLAEVTERRRAELELKDLNENLDRLVFERTRALEQLQSELREADRRKDEFIATLAHELRNPLAPVRSAAQILHRQASAADDAQWARDVIVRQVGIMVRLIDDLMDAESHQSGPDRASTRAGRPGTGS
jgi:response regulator RpfG family c-di-GMP phosphodiesterase